VTFCLKDLRAILAFCDVASCPIHLHFEVGGKPLIISTEMEQCFRANFVLATVACTDTSSEKPDRRPNTSVNKTRAVMKQTRRTNAGTAAIFKRSGSSSTAANGSAATVKTPASKHTEQNATDLPRQSQANGSPEIPDQNCNLTSSASVPEQEPCYKRIKTIFFEPSQQLTEAEKSLEVLAPDSDEEGFT